MAEQLNFAAEPRAPALQGLAGLDDDPPAKKISGPSGKEYYGIVLCNLRIYTQPRKGFIKIIESSWFDPLILVTILTNCVTMAWQSPLDPPGTDKAALIDFMEWVYLYIFTFELVAKIFSYGFVMQEGSYLHDAWCQLDFVVVGLAWIPILIPSFGNYSVIRSVRALRPLRALKRVPGMPQLVSAVMAAFPKLGNVVALCGFIFLVFGIVGMELFKGALHHRCATEGFVETVGHPVEARRLSLDVRMDLMSLEEPSFLPEPNGTVLASHTGGFMEWDGGTTCSYFDANVNYNLQSFDDIGRAFLLILQATTFDTWTDAMYALMDAFSPWVFIFFVLMALLGGIFVVQLFLAVIFEEFLTAQQLEAAKEAMQKQRRASMAGDAAPPAADSAPAAAAVASTKSDPEDPTTSLLRPQSRSCCDCTPRPGSWRAFLGDVMNSNVVGNVSTGLVVYNVYLMCLPYYGMSEEYDAALESKAAMVTWAFIIEMALKLLGMGCTAYWADGWNQLDGSIVIMSIADMIITVLLADTGVNLSFLRMLRLLRLLRLLKAWPGLYKIIITFGKAAPQMGNIFVLMFLCLLIFSLLGMQLYAGIYNEEVGYSSEDCPGDVCADSSLQPKPRYHWDYFMPAMLTCFIMMTGGWVDIVGPAYSVAGGSVIIYCVTVVIVGCFIILNLFIAVLLNAFSQDDEEEEGEEEGVEEGVEEKAQLESKEGGESAEKPRMHAIANGTSHLGQNGHQPPPRGGIPDVEVALPLNGKDGLPVTSMLASARSEIETDRSYWGIPLYSPRGISSAADPEHMEVLRAVISEHREHGLYGKAEEPDEGPPWPEGYSLLCFGPRNGFRRACQQLILDPRFDQTIVSAIVVSSICLAMDVPRLDPSSTTASVLHALDYFWTVLFFCEMMSKVVSYGFLFGEGAYVKDPWNLLDLLIVTVSFLVLLAEFFPMFEQFKVLRVLRVLRPLRLLARNPGMKLIIVSLFKSMPEVSNVFGVVIAFQLVFAILGMQIFMGRLASCTAGTITTRGECHPPDEPPAASRALLSTEEEDHAPLSGVFSRPAGPLLQLIPAYGFADMYAGVHPSQHARRHHEAANRRRRLKGGGSKGSENLIIQWINPPLGSFDSFGAAMLLLFVMSTGDGWDMIMYRMMDATSPDHGPVRDDFSFAAFFAIVWMFVGSFFAINLFVGVVVDNFNRINQENEEEGGGSATMTPEQAQWMEAMRTSQLAKPEPQMRPPDNCLRYGCFAIVTSSIFDTFIILVIIANVGVMACDYWGIENDAENFRLYNQAMGIFANIYYVECVLKLTGLGPGGYFSDNWCRFDFTLVCTSLLDQFAAELLEKFLPIPPMVLRVLRVLRILRILRLLKGPGAKQVRDLIMTLVLSFPSLINVGGVLLLAVFIYAVLGVNLFTYVVPQENLTANRNFKTLGSSMLLLFQALTGDNWSGMMIDTMVDESSGKCSQALGNCGSPHGAIAFFISFMLIAAFVVLNLVVAVILENFSSLGNVRTDLVSKDDIDTFKDAWATFDPDADLKIPAKHLPDLVLATPPPMGLSGVSRDRRKALRVCLALEVRSPAGVRAKLKQDENGEVTFADVLDALVQRTYKAVDLEGATERVDAAGGSDGDGADAGADGGGSAVARTFALETIQGHIFRATGLAARLAVKKRERLAAKESLKKGGGKKKGGAGGGPHGAKTSAPAGSEHGKKAGGGAGVKATRPKDDLGA